jgi:hypothetical protein
MRSVHSAINIASIKRRASVTGHHNEVRFKPIKSASKTLNYCLVYHRNYNRAHCTITSSAMRGDGGWRGIGRSQNYVMKSDTTRHETTLYPAGHACLKSRRKSLIKASREKLLADLQSICQSSRSVACCSREKQLLMTPRSGPAASRETFDRCGKKQADEMSPTDKEPDKPH